MRAIVSLSVGSWVWALAALGCHAGSAGGASTAAPIPLAAYCDAVAEQSCARFAPCCAQSGVPVDPVACRAQVRGTCATTVQAHKKSGHVFDPAAAGSCLAGADELFDGCAHRNDVFYRTQRTSAACAQVWTGKARPGEACADDADCAPQPGARVGCGGGTSTTCVAVPLAAVGQACDVGGTVGATIDCAVGAVCLPPVVTPEGDAGVGSATCVAPAPVGGRCSGRGPAECQDGLWCDVGPGTCQPPRAAGESCAGAPCRAGLDCRYPELVCHAPAQAGEGCATERDCSPGFACTASVCTALLPGGAECTWSGACASTICTFVDGHGTCAAGRANPPAGFDPSVCLGLVASGATAPSR